MAKATPKPLPEHLEVFLGVLEAQDPRQQPDRLAAMDAAEAMAGQPLVIADAMKLPAFALRYRRWEERLRMVMADAQIGRVQAGKASATPVIQAMGGFDGAGENGGGAAPTNNGKPVLGRRHAGRKAEFSSW